MITEKDIKGLAELARMTVPEADLPKLQKDLGEILNHFEELNAVDTAAVTPMSGGTTNENIYRADDGSRVAYPNPEKDFPETAGGFLKTPPVFSAEGGPASGGE